MQAPAKGTKRRSISYAKWGYIFIAPFFIAFAIFQLIPLASTIYYSFFEYYRSGLKVIGPNFTGLSNYVKLLSLDLPKYLGNTLLLWILGFVPQIIVSLLLAVWFTDNRLRIRCQPFFKTVIYMPNLIMASAFAMLFFALFSDNGPVNAALVSAGVLKEPFRFLSSIAGTRGLVALMNFLMWFGNTTILLMAAVMGIDLSLFEAAEIDGCSVIRKFFVIVLPLLKPVIATVVILVTLNVWNEFMTPLLFLQSREQDVILQEVSRNIGQFSTDWTALFPMLMLGVAPLMIFYIFMQKYIIAGVSAGAVKG